MRIDTTKPSVGRIYDYVLGGHHNFEVDRAAAAQILKVFPSYPTWARLNRWFLQMVAERWSAERRRHVLDLGSGMPTQGHFHTAMPNAAVLYTDSDPVTVAYAQEVIGNNSLVSFRLADIREPEEILESADQHFKGERCVAIGCIGISYFIDDASLARVMDTLHSWATPGSVMAISFIYGDLASPRTAEMSEAYRRNSGSNVFLRDEAAMRRLCAPWQVRECRPLAELLGMEDTMSEDVREGAGAEMYGALLGHARAS
jgi:hypothetical protein